MEEANLEPVLERWAGRVSLIDEKWVQKAIYIEEKDHESESVNRPSAWPRQVPVNV